jgi:2-keto-4-pentenoate hydratase/2-oxohepta-3-ene-1,7-dioic acid hydratase in catechol pathway
MKLCQYEVGGSGVRLGVALAGETCIGDLALGYLEHLAHAGRAPDAPGAIPATTEELLALGEPGRAAAQAAADVLAAHEAAGTLSEPLAWPLAQVRLYAPVRRPPKFFAIAINHRAMMARVRRAPDSTAAHYFIKLHTTIVGPNDPIEIPPIGQVGSEVELVAVIGKGGKNIPRDSALEHVYGYMLHNDVTAHEMRRTREWVVVNPGTDREERLSYPGRYKNIDRTAPLGPWLVTRDEIPDPQTILLQTWLNGSLCMEGSTADHVFPIAELVSYISQAHRLEPGDLISSGTVPAAAPWTFATIDYLKHGGVAETAGTGLGRQRNPILAIPG